MTNPMIVDIKGFGHKAVLAAVTTPADGDVATYDAAAGEWVAAAGAAPSGALHLVDCGVVDVVGLLDGPQLLYTPTAGQYVDVTVGPDAFAQTDYDVDIIPLDRVLTTATGLALFFWSSSFAQWWKIIDPNNTPVRGSVLASPVVATTWTQRHFYTIYARPSAWAAGHAYDQAPHTPANANCLIIGPDDHIWSVFVAGLSGGIIPDFAGNHGGSVVDNEVTWRDEGPIPSQGAVHVYVVVS